MAFSVITILVALVPFIMYTQPLYWSYLGENCTSQNQYNKLTSCYQGIKFVKGDLLQNFTVVFMILTLVLAGLTIIITLANMISRARGKKRVVGAKLTAFLFFIVALTSCVLILIYQSKAVGARTFEDIMSLTVGYGMLVSAVCALFTVIFAPKKVKNKE